MVGKYSKHPPKECSDEAVSGLFSRNLAFLTGGEIPVVMACDPGHNDIQYLKKFDPNPVVEGSLLEAKKILNLSRGTHNKKYA